jgi:hypothetical protein
MKPILCNTQVVQNVLAGRQTQDRRPTKGTIRSKSDGNKRRIFTTDKEIAEANEYLKEKQSSPLRRIDSKYQVGDVLYVRETWRVDNFGDFSNGTIPYAEYGAHVDYAADGSHGRKFILLNKDMKPELNRWYAKHRDSRYSPSIHMPKWAARIFLKITKVRVERIADISPKDAVAEGCPCFIKYGKDFEVLSTRKPVDRFMDLWESCYPGSWDRNDWVFVYDFERCEKPCKA